jgi:hypothetical protein
MVIALFMILDQLRIAETIVTIAFAATMGALALGLALAFGLGGRDVAARLLEDAYANGRRAKEQARQDFAAGRARAEDTVREYDSAGTPSGTYGESATTHAGGGSTATGAGNVTDGTSAPLTGRGPGSVR